MAGFDDRLAALEARLRLLEDEREIVGLIASYGPLVDAGAADDVAGLWTDDGVYEVDAYLMNGAAAVAEMVRSGPHQHLIAGGCAHFQGPVHVRVDGDVAVAVGYSLLVAHRDNRHHLARATANHWALARTTDGWRVTRRTSRLLDGNPAAPDLAAGPLRSS
ncbi:nuclear transport factor 2 family protein [Gordonia defluvii]|jgi:ketosteroid isomerase-like protein|uniref:Nuclear transport factor 2 family protein n=1 Tax=Gordonia defluvii TaxID=283718 RepID=A0ABN3YF27_9ACTN|nr:nuclear transport factor 2 family protein [Gordonia sp. UBA5067]